MTQVSSEMLIQYYYNELNATNKAMVLKAINENWTVKEKYAVIKASANRLNKYNTESTLRPQIITNLIQHAQRGLKTV